MQTLIAALIVSVVLLVVLVGIWFVGCFVYDREIKRTLSSKLRTKRRKFVDSMFRWAEYFLVLIGIEVIVIMVCNGLGIN